ncbi:unnamed protein product, partial [Polarella glacialis]
RVVVSICTVHRPFVFLLAEKRLKLMDGGARKRKSALRSVLVTPEMKHRMKEARAARKELYDTFSWSDGYLLAMLVGFSILGSVYRIKRQREMIIGISLFVLSFCVYLVIKSWDDAKKAERKKLEKEEKEQEEKAEKEEKERLKEEEIQENEEKTPLIVG